MFRIPPRGTPVAALSVSVPATVVAGTSAIVQWQADASDPTSFTLAVGTLPSASNLFANVTRAAGELEGSATTPPLQSPGPYYVEALFLMVIPFVIKTIEIVEPTATIIAQTSSTSTITQQSGESTSLTRTLSPTSVASISIDLSRSSSQSSIIPTIPIAGHISGLISSSSKGPSIQSTSIPTTSIVISQQSSTSLPLLTPLHKH
ncbi:hypothetical protein C8J56DRAFT_1159727, partial [Mycena floridula]